MSKSLSSAVEIPQAKVTRGWENIVKLHHHTPFCSLGTRGDSLGGPLLLAHLPELVAGISAQRTSHSDCRDKPHWYDPHPGTQ